MNKLVRYWNQNRGKIIITIAIIAFIIILIQIVNGILENSKAKRKESETIDYTKPVQSVITGEVVSEEKTTENTNIIKEFVDYCNSKNYQEAYNLLTEDCKAEFENNINTFITNYGSKIFNTPKTYKLELWVDMSGIYTYKIQYSEDNLLATGGINSGNYIEDYVSIVKQEETSKISINNFICKKTVNRIQTVNDIDVIVNYKKVYKDSETYNITIKNRTQKNIIISANRDDKDICLIGKNNVEYKSYLYEIPSSSMTLKAGYQRQLNIRFNKIYDSYRKIEALNFNNIILDADNFEKNNNNENIEKVQISVKL